ncbi:MAG: hypothetical protein LBR77_07255 [Lachnospiraceae bacterium]|nr:hypothetical protein [Lachnospiraceae bacterium]
MIKNRYIGVRVVAWLVVAVVLALAACRKSGGDKEAAAASEAALGGGADSPDSGVADGSQAGGAALGQGAAGGASSNGNFLTEEDLIAEGFVRVTGDEEEETLSDQEFLDDLADGIVGNYGIGDGTGSSANGIGGATSGGTSPGTAPSGGGSAAAGGAGGNVPGGGGAWIMALADTSGFDDLEGYEKPTAASVEWSDDGWGDGVEVYDWRAAMTPEELAEYEAMAAGDFEGMDGGEGQDAGGGDAATGGSQGAAGSGSGESSLPPMPGTMAGQPMSFDGNYMAVSAGVSEEQYKDYIAALKAAGYSKDAQENDMSAYGMGAMYTASGSGGEVTVIYNGGNLQVSLTK